MTRTLTLTRTVTTAADLDVSRITDLAIGSNGALYATTHYDGWVSAWDISGDALIQIDDAQHTSPLVAGAPPGLSLITRNGAPALLSGGHNGGSMSLRPLAGDGSFAGFINLGAATRFAGPFLQPVSLDLSGGTQAVYGGIVGGNGIAQLGFDGDGILTGTSIIASDAITTLTSGWVDGAQYLFTASTSDTNLRAWAVASDGALTLKTTMIAEDGLWVSAPTALASTVIAGTTYLVLASAGSSSLTVLQVGSTGTLGVVDHLLDDRHSRFAGASAIETVIHDGLTYVITGGSDDGISVYALLPGGRLVPRAHIADTDGMSLANISSIAVQARGSGLDLFVASASEPGLTRLRYEAGNAQVITGTTTPEALSGASGDDIIFDGGGSDTLTGNAGADLFVLDRDGVSDTISDFELGVDTLDLSGWTGLRSLNQLFFDTTATGITITYGDETLLVHSHDGSAIRVFDLSDTDLLSGARIPQVIEPGYPGPVTDPPPLPDRPIIDTPTQPEPPPETGIERLGTAEGDLLTGTGFADIIWGLGAADSITGQAGDDTLYGGSGADTVRGGDGNDVIAGGSGRDMGWANAADAQSPNGDRLYGDAGDDRIWGHAGADRLWGGEGDDMIWGGGGRDTFIFSSGQDRFMDFHPEIDTLLLDPNLWSGTRTAAHVVATFGTVTGGHAVFDFGEGRQLTLDHVSDLSALSDSLDFL